MKDFRSTPWPLCLSISESQALPPLPQTSTSPVIPQGEKDRLSVSLEKQVSFSLSLSLSLPGDGSADGGGIRDSAPWISPKVGLQPPQCSPGPLLLLPRRPCSGPWSPGVPGCAKFPVLLHLMGAQGLGD